MKREPVAYVELHIKYPSSRGDEPLPDPVLDYHERIEEQLDRLEQLKQVDHIGRRASRFEHKDEEWWHECYALAVLDERVIERMADRIVRFVRRLGIRHKHRFWLEKQILHDNEERDVYSRRIYPARDVNWVLYQPKTSLKPSMNPPTEFPAQLSYLAAMAGRCFLVGGNDIWGLLAKELDLRAFIGNLSPTDRAELVDIYLTIVRKKHNQWFLDWLKHNEQDVPAWVHEFGWLLAVLDRLRQGGLLSGTRGVAKKTVLVYWDDYLSGKPYTEETV